jgi:TolB-like protein
MAEAIKTNPEISIESFKTYQPFQNRADLQKILYALRMSGMPEKPRNAMQEKPSIAVLPFVNMSKDPEQEYFSDGMSEEIIGALAKLEGLKVISRTSAFYFKGEHVDLRTIGEKLKVENVLEGSVRKAGKKLRISAQLIKVDDDTHLWAETYDRELEDVFAIQDEISHSIVKNLKGKLLGRQTEPLVKDYTKNTEAYQFFLKGKFFHSRSVSEWEMAIESYEKAINTDPEFAPPYSNLASIYITYALAHSLPSREMWVKIKKLVRKALEIDETNSEAHASMGFIKAWFEFDWSGADSAHNRAIELNPGSSVAYYRYAIFLMGVGRVYEATDKMKQALEFDPLSVFLHATLGITYYFAHQFDKAIVQMQKTLELVPNEPYAIGVLALSHAVKGVYEEGIEILIKAGRKM